jgi:hypothetical protein
MKLILFNTKFEISRIKIAATKLNNEIQNFKRSATNITRTTIKYINFDKNKSNHSRTNFQIQNKFLNDLLIDLNDEKKSLEILENFNNLRKNLIKKEFVRFHLVLDVFNYNNLKSICIDPFKNHFNNLDLQLEKIIFLNQIIDFDISNNFGKKKIYLL